MKDITDIKKDAQLLMDQGKHEEVRQLLLEAADSYPDDPEIHSQLAETLAKLGMHDDAITEYQIAISIEPDKPDTHYRLASLLRTTRQFEDAKYHYEYSARLRPDNPDNHTGLGQTYLAMNKPDQARESAMHALNLDKQHAAALDLLTSIEALPTKTSEASANNSPAEDPMVFEKLGQYCIEFQLNKQFITDNRFIFTAPDTDFCRNCFQYRYLSQMEGTEIKRVSDDALSLARKLDDESGQHDSWQIYSIDEQKLVKTFDLAPYDNCPACDTSGITSRDEASSWYRARLEDERTPQPGALKERLFSFGFARDGIVSRKSHLPNPEFDKLLGNNYHARLHSKITYPDGRQIEETPMGLSPDRDLAELKSFMEFVERYAFFSRSSRLITGEHDDKIINRFLSLYRDKPSEDELRHIRNQAVWGLNLATRDIIPIPLAFIYNSGKPEFIAPNTSGFGAHTDFGRSLCSSILELVERDAFVRFWHSPQRAFVFEPDSHIRSEIDKIISILARALNNPELAGRCFIVKSPTRLPVVMITISSSNFSKPPALCFGYGVDFDMSAATSGALNELRTNAINLVKAIMMFSSFLSRQFTDRITSIPDRMNFYSTHTPRAKLHFLDQDNPPPEGIVEEIHEPDLESLIERFRQSELDVYGIDVTPRAFEDLDVYATRAFSPQLYPLQFEQENAYNILSASDSLAGELPHCFQ